ncbi:MAG: DNA polymerase I [Chloroflexota bacterium]
MSNKLVLIDGHALAYRVFFALPVESFTTKSGEPTNATYGFTRTLLDLLLAADPPQYLAVSFDVGATFRDGWYADYKGTRAKMPDELQTQIERIREVIQAMNVPILEKEGFEADDVLGTVARQAKAAGVPVVIITGDRDLLQLVDDNTRVELPPGTYQKEPRLYNEAAVVAEYGLRPGQIVDYKALVGDKSDNIPGVRGVGEKTAVELLQKYGTLDNVYANLEAIPARYANKLRDDRENAYLSYKLARIVTDAPVTLDLAACATHGFEGAAVLDLFRQLEFRSLTNRLAEAVQLSGDSKQLAVGSNQLSEKTGPTETVIVRTEEALQELVAELEAAGEIAFDVETTSVDERLAELVGLCLSTQSPRAYYVPVGHLVGETQSESGQMGLFGGTAKLAEGQLPLDKVLAAVRPALTNPAIPKLAHNAKFDYAILDRLGVRVTPIAFDTMIAEWLTDPASKHLGLKDLARHRLGVEMTEITELIGKGKGQKTFAEVPVDLAAPYGSADADVTLRLAKVLQPELQNLGLASLFHDIEMPLIPVLAAMESVGVGIDTAFFQQMSRELAARLLELEKEIHRIAGRPFNINSTQQLSDVLFKELKIPHEGLRKTSSGHYSTAADVLESIRELDPTGIINLISEYRELGKLKSTYVDALPAMVNPKTGRIHTSFNQTGAITGRIASSSPNLQNIPIRAEVGQKIRRGFVSRPGWVFLAADYSQVELRIMAHVSQDKALMEAFWQDQDIHRSTAAAVFSIPMEEVTPNQRRFAKAVNFGLIYGMGAFRLARDSGLTLAEAEKYIKAYFDRFPGIQAYLEGTKEKAKKLGYVETLLGRRRYFPIFSAASASMDVRQRAEREAINHPIQGTAADVIKIAMIRLHDQLTAGYRGRLILQVHDELVLEVPEEEAAELKPLVVETMSNAFHLDVPLKVEAHTGRNWLELKD